MTKDDYHYKVAYQGIPGAYSDIAGKKYFMQKIIACPMNNFEELFKSVKNKTCNYGMVPIENSIAGSVYENYDLLAKYNLKIVGEIYLRISHNLLVIPIKGMSIRNRLNTIKKVYSHPQALRQCQKFFEKYSLTQPEIEADTALSAQIVSKRKKNDIAAIASTKAAKIYNLEILKKGIESNKNNYTRFIVIGNRQKNENANKISLIFSVSHKPGSLYQSLRFFAERKINLTKIESRPILGKPWEYLFYLDFEFDPAKQDCLKAISKLRKNCLYLKILGFYRRGKYAKS